MMQLDNELKQAVVELKKSAKELADSIAQRQASAGHCSSSIADDLQVRGSSIALTSGCELFLRFVTRQFLEIPEFTACKRKLMERGQYISKLSAQSRQKIMLLFAPFFRDNMTILVIGYSRVVVATLKHYASLGKRFSVMVPEMRPDGEGYKTVAELRSVGIPVTLVLDSAVAHIMSKVDFVLTGAEGVVENGGIINKIGTYQIAIVAEALKKSFYVAAESFKFVRQFPLSQDDIMNIEYINKPQFVPIANGLENVISGGSGDGASTAAMTPADVVSPASDYTPPKYISLLFTDLGVLTPSGISDELIHAFS